MTTTSSADVIRAGLYQRVSTSDQSTDHQNAENMRVAAAKGWHVTEYDDPGLSASRFASAKGGSNRGDWRRLLADVKAGCIDVLVFWEPARGSRQLTGWSTLLDLCRERGVLVHITREHCTYDLASARDWKTLAEDGITAAYRSEEMSKDIKSGKDRGQEAGRPQGSVAYGVHRVRDAEKTCHAWLRDEPDPATAPVVARIITEAAAGRPLAHIAAGLTADAVPTPSGAAAWHGTTVAGIARNPVYATTTPPVVTEALSLKARARLARAKRAGERPARQVHRYSRCLSCSVCGAPVAGYTDSKGQGRYRCLRGHVSIASAEMDAWIDMLAIERLSRPDLVSLFAGPGDSTAATAARAEAARLRAELDEWLTAGVSARAYKIKEDELLPRIAAADRRAAEAEMPSVLAGIPDQDRAVVQARWEALSVAARREAVKALAPRAILRPGTRGHRSSGSGRHGAGTPIDERVDLWPDE